MQTFRTLTFGLGCLFASSCISMTNVAQASDRVALFDGVSLSGWSVTEEHPDSFRVEDGAIVASGPRAHLFYNGPLGVEFSDFELTMQVMTTLGSNSGVFFHTKYQPEGWPSHGLEAQLNATQGDPRKTGSLYAVADIRVYEDDIAQPKLGHDTNSFITLADPPHKDDEWFRYTIRVENGTVTTLVDDRILVQWKQPEDWTDAKRRLSTGTFALQAHDQDSTVMFKDIVVELFE